MEIAVSGRHFTITEEIKQKVNAALNGEFENLPLKIVSAQVILDIQGSRALAEVVVHIKNNHVATAKVEEYDLYKAIDAAILKTGVQARKLIDKLQDHKKAEKIQPEIPVPAEE